jgi:hypothetical protein
MENFLWKRVWFSWYFPRFFQVVHQKIITKKWRKSLRGVTDLSVFLSRGACTRGINLHTSSAPLALHRQIQRDYNILTSDPSHKPQDRFRKNFFVEAGLRSISYRLSHKRARFVNPLKTRCCDGQTDKTRTIAYWKDAKNSPSPRDINSHHHYQIKSVINIKSARLLNKHQNAFSYFFI